MGRRHTYGELAQTVKDLRQELDLRKRAEQEVMHLFDMAIDMLCVFGFDNVFTRLNPAFERTLGFTTKELTARPFFEFIHPDDRDRTRAAAKKAYSTGKLVFAFENRFLCKDGSYRWISWAARPVLEEKTVYSVGRDVTDLKRAQAELRKARDELELRVDERTAELVQANKKMKHEIKERRKAMKALRESERSLATQNANLEELNTALKVLLRKRAEDRAEIEEKFFLNRRQLIQPYLEKLKQSGLNERQMAYAGILESNLDDLVSPFVSSLSSGYLRLTPAEIQTADLVRRGKTTKEIAELLTLSHRTVEFHRENIRGKFGLKKQKTNLRSYLLTIP
jgi:PAS domain S-box-containing protein